MSGLALKLPLCLKSTVACCVRDETACRLASDVLRSQGAASAEIAWPDLASLDAPPDWQALIYDLQPWDKRAVDVVERCRGTAPAAPVLLYSPAIPGVGTLLEACPRDPTVMIQLQFSDRQEFERLQASIQRLLAQIPCEQLALLVRAAFPQLSDRMWCYIRRAFAVIMRHEHPTAHGVAASVGVSVRTLERGFRAMGLPRPKELLSWLTLLYLTLIAHRSSQSLASAARAMGWRPGKLYRLRRRLLRCDSGLQSVVGRTSPHTEFDLILIAFLKRSGVSERTRQDLLDKAG